MSDFSLSRSIRVGAEPERVHRLVDDFREWRSWSPWEDVDPDLVREYSGPERGVGSTYRWSGNRKAGEGTMTVSSSTPGSVVIDLVFLKPFKAANVCTFTLVAAGAATRATEVTEVTWTMTGTRNPVMGLAGRLFVDKAIGKDFDKGLAALKQEAERSA